MLLKTALVVVSLLNPLALANPDPRPPGPPPPLDYAKLGSLDITPKQALDADARAVDAVSIPVERGETLPLTADVALCTESSCFVLKED